MTNFTQKLEAERGNNTKPPVIWLCKGKDGGDFNNGLAIANALKPAEIHILKVDHKRGINILHDMNLDWVSTPGNSINVCFENPVTGKLKYTVVSRKNFPDILIDSTNNEAWRQHKSVGITSKTEFKPISPLDKTLVVNIFPPDYLFDCFYHPSIDMNIVFDHQMIRPNFIQQPITHTNVHVYDTVPTRINEKTLKKGRKLWGDTLSIFEKNRPVYCVIMGELLKTDFSLSSQDAKDLAANVSAAIKKTGGSVVLTTSPRTKHGKQLIADFTSGLDPKTACYCHDYHASVGKNNPYEGLLDVADRIIVTNDSMSMQSDAVATGKPTYVYQRFASPLPEALGGKPNERVGHDEYTQSLLRKGLVMPIEKLADPAPAINPHPVNSAEQIANDIRAELAKKRGQKYNQSNSLITISR